MSAYSFTSSKSKLKFDSSTSGTGTSRHASIGSSRLDTGSSSRYPLSSRLDSSPSRWDTDLDRTSSALRSSTTSRWDGGSARMERSSRYGNSTDPEGGTASRWESRSSRYTRDSDSDAVPFRRESYTSKYLTDSPDIESGSTRHDRTSRLYGRESSEADTSMTSKYVSKYTTESIDSETMPSTRYERKSSRLSTESSEMDKTPSRWDKTTSRSSDYDIGSTRLDRKTSRLMSESDEPTRHERSSRYTIDSTETETGSPKWESEYSSQYKSWDSGASQLERQSSRLSTDSTELDSRISRFDAQTSREDRQSSRACDSESETSRWEKRFSQLESSSYGLVSEPTQLDTESSGLVRTSSGMIRLDARRETDPDSNLSKPEVKKTIKSITQSEGQTATLECEIYGNPIPSVQWLKQNKIISSEDRFVIGSDGSRHYLIINDLHNEDVGLYTVAATNSLGTSSSSATINVLPGPGSPRLDSRPTSPGGSFLPHSPMFKVKLKDTELLDGTTVRFELVVRGMPIPSVTFYKDNEVLKEDNRIRVLYESKEVFELMIEHITEEDAGVYKCVAINSEGKDETSGRITVTKHKDVFPGIEDQPFVDTSRADSLSPRSRSPVFKWFKDGKEFEASERFQVQFDDEEDTITLVFQHVKPEDAGLYTCAASTSSGKISCSAELTVQGLITQLPRDPVPPTIKLSMADVEVSEGASAMLEAKVTAFPRPRIRWFKGQELIESGERFKFLYEDDESYSVVIKQTRRQDEGMYRIEATNDLGQADTSARLTVNVAPKFKKQMKDQSVMTDECLTLEVEINANPTPNVKWFRDGIEVIERKGIKILNERQNGFELVIEKVKIEDSGKYSCVATNELGQQSSHSVIKVNGPPVFSSKLERVEALEGKKAEMAVKVTGYPKPNIKFTKNEKIIKTNDSRVEVIDEGNGGFRLVLKETDSSDSGKYKCIATNEWGEDSSEAELTIRRNVMKPNFTKRLQDIESKEGDQQIEFNVKVEAMPKPEIKWFREGLQIKERDGFKYIIDNDKQSYTLVIPTVKAESAGTYRCEATNSEGKAETSGVLTVNTLPQFTKKLENMSVDETQDVKLSVKVIGCPTPDLKWFKGETSIKTNDKRLRYEEESNEYTLVLNNTSVEDSALYKVIAENVFGKCETKGELTVSSTTNKPVFTQLLSDREVIEHESNVEFVVKIDSQKSQPIIKWFIDEQEIKESDKRYELVSIERRNTYKLVIKSATEETVGRYKCLVTNPSGSCETSAKFNVITKPKFIKGLEDIEANEGETVSMTVRVKGSPEPEVTFLKDGRDVSTEATVVVKREIDDIYILEIENIRIIMSGDYQCHIKNKAGEAFSNGTVIVNSKPKFVKDLEDKESGVNENVVLEVVVTGSPTPEITWFKDGIKMNGTERVILESREEIFKLKLDNANTDDSGVYKCRARNKSGEVESKPAQLNVNQSNTSPVFVTHISDTEVVVGDVVRFEAKVEGKPEPQVVWFQNGSELRPNGRIKIRNVDKNTHELVINDLKVEDSGDIVCKGLNEKGQAMDRAKLTVQEPESPTFVSLNDIAVVEETPAELKAEIKGIPKPSVNWFKDDIPVDEVLVFNEPEKDLYSLRFKSVTEDLTGKYVCNASNTEGNVQQSAELTICGKIPKFIRELDDILTMSVEKEKGKLVLGQSAVFEAQVTGVPQPKVSWLKNGVEMVPKDNTRITISNTDEECKLEIKTIAREDVAQYVCKAVNPYGEAKSVCLLKFQDTPHPPIVKKELPKTVAVEEGTQLVLTAHVDGEPIPSTQWLRNGEPIKPLEEYKILDNSDGTTSLIVDNVMPQNSGEYALKATNLKGEVITSTKVNVEPPQKKPSFEIELPKQISLEEGHPLCLTVKVDGQPVPSVKWFKNDCPIMASENVRVEQRPDGTNELNILRPKQNDSGVYMIKATNPSGQTCSSTTVHIIAPQMAPNLIKKLSKKIKLDFGEPLVLEAKVSGEPIPEIRWTKDGIDIQSSDKIKIDVKPNGTVSLKKEKTDSKDSGIYEMFANNLLGKISSLAEVEIKPQKEDKVLETVLQERLDVKEPKIESQFDKKLDVFEGNSLTLCAKIDGKPMPDVQWLKDDVPIKQSDGYKVDIKPDGTVELSVDTARPKDSGKYTLIVENSLGEVRASADVDVQKGSVIDKKLPQNVDVIIGHSLQLEAKVDGKPIPKVEWTKDGLPIKESDVVTVETKPDGTVLLNIDQTKAEDSGEYAVVAKSSTGDIVSSTKVDVQKGPIFVDRLPEYVDTIIGKALNLSAKIVSDIKPEINWTKDGLPVKESQNTRIVSKSDGTVELNISCAQPIDTGKYAVIAKTGDKEVISECDVDVQNGPIFREQLPQCLNVVEGKPVNLFARVDGNPLPEVIWTKDSVEIKPSEGIVIKSKPDGAVSLLIESAKTDDSGKYGLIAKSPSGEVMSITDVDVKKGAIIKEKLPAFVNISEGQPLILVTKSEGLFLKDIKWTKNGVPIKPMDGMKVETKPNGNISLCIDSAQPSDAGIYELIIKTPTEELKTSSDVKVVQTDKEPEIKTPFPQRVELIEGKPLILTAEVVGKPLPELTWLKDDVPIKSNDEIKIESKPDGTVSLSVERTKPEDSGKYTLIAENCLGEAMASTEVDVQKGPIITEKLPQNVDVVIGKPFTLTAKVEGEPNPEVKWTKDGVPIKAKDGVKIETKPDGTVELTVDTAKPQNAGQYSLIAKTVSGDMVSSAVVDVHKGPIIVERLPEYVDIIEGKPLHLTARVDGLPAPIVKWTKDGNRLEPSDLVKIETRPDGTVSLSIDCTQPTDLGKYALIAKNSIGEAVSESDVDVQKGPIIRDKLPDSMNVTEGKPFALIAKVDGNPMPEVIWTKDGIHIEPMDGIEIKSKPDGTVCLSVDCAQIDDSGRYAVIVRSPSGEVVSKTNVDVQSGPIIKERLPEYVNIKEGKSLELVAKVEAQPLPQVMWTKNGVPLEGNDRMKVNSKPNGEFSLCIDGTQPSDAGKYSLVVQTPDKDISTESDVNVIKNDSKEPKIIDKFSPIVDVIEGKPFVLSAKVEGKPKPDIKWLKDDVPLKSNKNVKIESKPDGTVSLSVDRSKPEDSGKYTLIVENCLGEAMASSEVDVQKGPIITEKLPQNVDVVIGKPFTLTAKVGGEPNPEVMWTKDGVPLQESDGVRLTTGPDGMIGLSIDRAIPENTGQYAVVAKSPAGEVSSLSNVDVLKGPLVVERLPENIDVMAGNGLDLKARVDAEQLPLIKWTKDDIRVEPNHRIHIESKPDGTVSLSIDCAQLSDTGRYAVIAKTQDGEDISTSNVFVQKGPVVLQALPDCVNLCEGKALNLKAKFDGKPAPEVIWFKDNIPLKCSEKIDIKTKPDGTTSLSIDSTKTIDSGEYAVIAKSPVGEVMSLSKVDVKKGPVFKQKLPEALKVSKGTPIKLVAKLDGLPVQQPVAPVINWVKDGYPVRFTEKIKFETKPNGLVSLSIASALPKDSGKYAVIAKTPDGEITSTTALAVKNPPIFKTSLPETLDVVEGKALKLFAIIESDAIPEIVWYKNDVPIKGSQEVVMKAKPDGTACLEIACAKVTDCGQYAVMAKTSSGQCKSSCDVSVQKGLIFIDNLPHSLTVCEGKPLNLSAKLDGKPLPDVTWIKDGIALKSSDGVEIRSKPDGTYLLTIGSAKPSDSGEYVMIARNPNEEVVAVTNVDVEKGPVVREKLPERVDIIVGKPLELIAKIESDEPIDKIIWTKDGVPIRASEDIKLKSRPDGTVCLSIDCTKLSDSGKYAVFAKVGNRGVGSMSVVTVKDSKKEVVEESPEPEGEEDEDVSDADFKDKLPKTLSITEGNPLKLVAKIARKGERLPDFIWTKNGKPLELSNRVKRETTPNGTVSVKIDSSLLSDSGNYVLSFKSSEGIKMSSVSVQIIPKSTIDRPVFIKGLNRISAEEGKSCRFECKVSGDIDAINWYRNGENISANEHFRFIKESDGTLALVIDSVDSDDAGEYSVNVENKAGKADSSAPLKVISKPKEKPMFLEELKPIIVSEGNELVLKAVYKSDLPVVIKWMKDGFELQSDHRIHLSEGPNGTITLTIGSSKLDDSGKYSVSIVNDEGRVRSSGAVTVSSKAEAKPQITEGLIPMTLIAGEQGKLSVRAVGEPMPEVRFIKDGQQIIPNDRVHMRAQPYGKTELVFDEVRPQDEGNYIAIAVNDCGEARSSAPIGVNRSPKFDNPLTDTTGIEGYPAKLEAKVDGRPKPDIVWMKNGQTLSPDNHHMKVYAGDDGTHTLLFDKCKDNDSGTYGLTASNEFGKTETSAKLVVKSKIDDKGPESAPVFIGSLQDVCVYEGQNIEFFAEVKANPIPDIKWYFNGQPISASDNIVFTFDGIKAHLKITKCEAKHKGLYELKVSNSLGDTTSKAKAEVYGKSGPKFIEKFTDCEIGVSKPLKLVCRVTGLPVPDIAWFCNGNQIEPGIHYSIIREGEVCSLVIVRPTDKMTGIYECKASNICGADSCRANITFMDTEAKGEAASFLKKLSDCEVGEGKTAKFTACVTGSPKPEIKWFKDGVEFEPLSSKTKYNVEYQRNGLIRFEILNVRHEDLGEYRCHAMNSLGYDNSIANLTFESLDKHKRKPSVDKLSDKFKQSGVPVPLPDRPKIIRMSDTDLTLSWLPSIPIQPRIPVTYIVEFCETPGEEWIAYRTGIKDSQCDVGGLSPGQDYSFRTRVENKYGISDPSPFVTAFRSKLKPTKESMARQPKDYDLEHLPLDKHECAPRFLREQELTIYAIRGQPVTLEFWIYGHPDPNIVWHFEDAKIQTGSGSRFDTMQDRNGQNCLFITKMTDSDVGWYTCVATNSCGTEQRKVKLMIAEAPVFTKRFEETTVLSRRHARFECSVVGTPEPTVRWFKDWQPLHESDRIKILWESPERATLFINGAIVKDSGLYSCLASNVAGHASISAMLHIEESELEYDKYTFGYNKFIKPKTKPFETYYDIGDELGRGTQGILYHSVERSTGKSFASKMMHGRDQMKDYMTSELEIMNQLGFHPRISRLWDAFTSTPHSMTLITDLCGGGELLHHILQKGSLTESEIAHFVRQILEGLEYMHFKNISHFGLTIGDILLERVNGNDIKIADFGLAQRVIPGLKYIIEFGHPEFIAPEILEKQSASYEADVWAVGIITYILMTGISPFLGDTDRSTLQYLQLGKIDFSHQLLTEISLDGKDFLTKVLERDQYKRLDVKAALQHPWLKLADRPETGTQLNCLENLRQYHKRWKNWHLNASCKTHYRRRPLHSCFTHPSRMIYPPDERYTPPPSPEREMGRSKFKPSQFDETFKQKISRDTVDARSESQYQSGPDTYLLQLRDTDFATRIRRYLRVGAARSPSLAASLRESHWGDSNSNQGYKPSVSVRERRKFTDIMDEEIGEEKQGLETRSKPMRLVREIGTSGYAYGQLHHLKKEAFANVTTNIVPKGTTSKQPFFREKFKDIVVKENEDVVFSCLAVGDPTPSYTWFRNDGILIESSRIEVKRTEEGRCELRIKPARAYDVGQYKCVARNDGGAVVCRARLNMGDTPGTPEPPEIKSGSNREVYLCWSPPKQVGNSHIICYRLEYKKMDDQKWTVVADNIMHEFYVVRDLEPETSYHFRTTARNRFGWSTASAMSESVKTLSLDDNQRLKVPRAQIYRQTVTEDIGRVIIDDTPKIPDIDYSKELNPIALTDGEHDSLYEFMSEISRGRFSLVSNTRVKELNKTFVSKTVLTQSETESGISNEYEIMKSLANERIVQLHYASRGSGVYALIMEKLSGIDVLTFLSQRQKYNEEIVSKIVIQVLDGIEYLHFRGICILELQPDNVVMIDQRRHDIKICDFANARRVPIAGTRVSVTASPEYVAPELIKKDEVTNSADIWCVGVFTYILLSGVSPFRGSDDNETAQNVVYVRYLFDHLYPEITQEAIRFILTIFKLTPHKRPTIEECLDHKWLLPNEFMTKKRETAIFSSHRLTEFADEFHSTKSCSMPSRLANIAGISLARSISLQNDSFDEI